MIERQERSWKRGGLALVLLAVLGVLVIMPLTVLFGGILPGDATELELLRELLRGAPLQQAILHTFAVALLACGLASLIAIPLAFAAVRAGKTARIMIQIFAFLPLTMPPFVGAAVLRNFTDALAHADAAQWLPALNIRGSHLALILIFALHYLPFILFSLMAGLARIDRSLSESARNLGASRLFVWHRITLPLATPAYVIGASLMVLRIFEDVGTPLMLGIEGMLAPQIVLGSQIGDLSDPALGMSALVLLAASMVITLLAWSALADPLAATGKECGSQPAQWRGGFGGATITLAVLPGLGMLALGPHLWLVLMSVTTAWSDSLMPLAVDPGSYGQLLRAALPGLKTTLVYAAAAGMLTLLLGSLFGSLTRSPGPISRITRLATTSLFAVPGLVLALAYARTQDLLDPQLDGGPGLAWLALILVIALKQLPLAQHLAARRLRELHSGQLDSARSLGASGVSAGLRIGLPSITAVLAAVFLLGSTAALVELSAVLLLIQDPDAPLALSLFQAMLSPADVQMAATQGVFLVALTATMLSTLYWFLRRRCYDPKPPGSRKPSVARSKS
ncbi:MAG: ABC transporter permease subunit [Gammaproteobacteria bacterium]|nr:ABC transporter permease subunit [Gammaproteobacteria bacterium]